MSLMLNIALCQEFKDLKEFLQIYNKKLLKGKSDEDSLYKMIEKDIQGAIEDALKTESVESVRAQMLFLCQTSFDVPIQLREWAVKEIDTVYTRVKKEEESQSQSVPSLPSQEEKPLLNKDTLYHASLCCQAVSTCTTLNYKNFFSRAGNGHSLKEISMSISQDRENVDRYIIAKQENNVVYMAFQSEPTLMKWIDSSYNSFANGKLILNAHVSL